MVTGTAFADLTNIAHLGREIQIFRGDLRDREWVQAMVRAVRPDVVFHLAAQSFVTVSWVDPEGTLATNVSGTLNILDAIRGSCPSALIIIVGSSAVLGPRSPDEMPLHEDAEFRPTSIYAVSKVAEEMLGYFYWRAHGLGVVRVRPFNMTGPRKVGDACSDFARSIVEVSAGLRATLDVGNLDSVRDLTDGRDAAVALWTLARHGTPGEVYNLCSGLPRRMKDVLGRLLELAGTDVEYRVVPEKLRPVDDPIHVGDNGRLRALGWSPKIPFDKTLTDTLAYWRQRLAREGVTAS